MKSINSSFVGPLCALKKKSWMIEGLLSLSLLRVMSRRLLCAAGNPTQLFLNWVVFLLCLFFNCPGEDRQPYSLLFFNEQLTFLLSHFNLYCCLCLLAWLSEPIINNAQPTESWVKQRSAARPEANQRQQINSIAAGAPIPSICLSLEWANKESIITVQGYKSWFVAVPQK